MFGIDQSDDFFKLNIRIGMMFGLLANYFVVMYTTYKYTYGFISCNIEYCKFIQLSLHLY